METFSDSVYGSFLHKFLVHIELKFMKSMPHQIDGVKKYIGMFEL